MQNKILKLSFLLVFTFIGCKAQNKNVDLSEKLTSKATELIDELCEDDRFSGTIIVAKKDSVLYQFACGEASKRFHIKNNIDTKFNLGSNNKMFTWEHNQCQSTFGVVVLWTSSCRPVKFHIK